MTHPKPQLLSRNVLICELALVCKYSYAKIADLTGMSHSMMRVIVYKMCRVSRSWLIENIKDFSIHFPVKPSTTFLREHADEYMKAIKQYVEWRDLKEMDDYTGY